MAKVGTAQIEIKPVLNAEALTVIEGAIREAVAKGVRDGMAAAFSDRQTETVIHVEGFPGQITFPPSAGNPFV